MTDRWKRQIDDEKALTGYSWTEELGGQGDTGRQAALDELALRAERLAGERVLTQRAPVPDMMFDDPAFVSLQGDAARHGLKVTPAEMQQRRQEWSGFLAEVQAPIDLTDRAGFVSRIEHEFTTLHPQFAQTDPETIGEAAQYAARMLGQGFLEDRLKWFDVTARVLANGPRPAPETDPDSETDPGRTSVVSPMAPSVPPAPQPQASDMVSELRAAQRKAGLIR